MVMQEEKEEEEEEGEDEEGEEEKDEEEEDRDGEKGDREKKSLEIGFFFCGRWLLECEKMCAKKSQDPTLIEWRGAKLSAPDLDQGKVKNKK